MRNTKPLETCAHIVMGQSPDSSSYNETNGISFLQGCSDFGQKSPHSRVFTTRPNKIAKKYSTLISVRAPVGTTNIANREYCIGRGLASIFEINGVSINQFLHYTIQNAVPQLLQKAQGSTFEAISSDALRQLKVYCPDLQTQKRIAKILSTVDGQIEKTEAIIAKYQAIKQGMLHDLFTRGIDLATGKLRPTPEQAPELYKQSLLGLIPKDWEFINFGNKIVSSKYGPRFNANDYSDSGNVKTIRGTDITKNGEILYNQVPKAKLSNLIINANKLIENDVLIVTTADCGLTTVFCPPIRHENYIPSAYTVRCRFNNDVDIPFIKYYMNTDSAIKQVNSYVRQGTLGNLPGSDILKINLGIPSINEQMKISSEIKSLDLLIKKENLILNQLKDVKQGLIIKLLT